MAAAKDDPSALHPEIQRLRAAAKLPLTLMGGTPAMRKAGELYLPRMRHEETDTYEGRLKITTLRNFYRQGLQGLAGKLMRNGLKLDQSAKHKGPAEMADWLTDLDCCGTSGDVLFKRSFIWGVRDAAMWLLAAYPKTIGPNGKKPSLADERELQIRPWLVPLSIWDVLGWREERKGGRNELSQFRYMMVTEEPDGQFGTKNVETIRVVEPELITDFRRASKRSEWTKFDEMPNTLKRVPVQRIASDMDENHAPRGGMDELAWLNLEHWQLRSDQRLTLRINAFPILFGAGMSKLPPIGPESAVLADDVNAKLSFVESAGTALTAGRQELIDLEDVMRAQVAMYQVRQTVQKTATETATEAAEANSPAQGWAINAKRGFEAAMDDMAELAGKGDGAGAGGILKVDTDALVSSMDSAKLSELRAARASREISRKTYLEALKRADVLPDEYDADADQDEIDNEPVPETEGLNKPPARK
jgi:hypothetical protein